MNAKEIGDIFSDVAVLLELNGENQFKVRAYESAARLLSSQTLDAQELIGEVESGRIKGIGSGLLEAIRELEEHGSYSVFEELKSTVPEGFLDLLALPGLGPKKLKLLREELGITGIDDLLKACAENRVCELKGFSEKTQAKLIEAAERFKINSEKYRLPQALEAAQAMIAKDPSKHLIPSGEFRRGLPVISEIVVSDSTRPFELLFETGSESHLAQLRNWASSRGFTLTREGILKGKTETTVSSEEELYTTLELAYIPPELREGRGEIEEAATLFQSGRQKFDLVEREDLQGILHAHSTYSDGIHSLKEMAEAARALGYSYLGITDHSQSAAYAGGLKPPIIRKQREEIDRLNSELAPFRIFHGIESDILGDGSLDYEDEILSRFDFVIASVHSRFSLDRDAMTKRLVKAVENPYTCILGHSSGRKLLEREPYEFDIEAVLRAAQECGTAVEINASPKRLDIDWTQVSLARDLGLQVPICPDAHSIKGMDDVQWGILTARKGGLSKAQVLNCKNAAGFSAWCSDRMGR